MLDKLRQKSRTFGVYLVFAALIVIFAVGFGAVAPEQSCGGGPGVFRNVDFVEVDGETIDALLVRTASELTGDAPTPRQPQPSPAYLSRLVGVALYSPWSGARFARGSETASPIKLAKVTDDLIEQKLVASWARSLGLSVSKKELQDSLALRLDSFRDEKTGAFDSDNYRGWVQRLGASVSGFESLVGDEVLRERVIQLLVGEVGVTDAELAIAHRLENEQVTIEHIIVDRASAAPLVPVTDKDVNDFLAANADKVQAEYDKTKATRYTTPRTLTLRVIRVAAANPNVATDDEQKAALEEERKAARAKADAALVSFNQKVAAPTPTPDAEPPAPMAPHDAFAALATEVSDDESKSNGGLVGEIKLPDLARFPYDPALATAAATLAPNTPSAVIETSGAFWILFADAVKEETVTAFDTAKSEVAKGLVQVDRAAEFKKALADEVLAEAKKDPKKALSEVVTAIHTKYGVESGLSVGTASFSRLRRAGPGYPATTPFLSAFNDRVPTLVAAAFNASAEAPLIEQVVVADDGDKLIVARFTEKTPAPELTEDQKKELRNSMVWERRRTLYRGWYEDLLAKRMADGDIDTTSDYEEQKKLAEESFVQAGGTLPIKVEPAK